MNLCVPPHWCIPRRSVGLSPVTLSSSSKVGRKEVAGPGGWPLAFTWKLRKDTPLVTVVVPSIVFLSSSFLSCEWVSMCTGFMASAANVTLVPGGDIHISVTEYYSVLRSAPERTICENHSLASVYYKNVTLYPKGCPTAKS